MGRLNDTINNKLIPSFTYKKLCGNDERILLSLPTKLCGMGISVFPDLLKKRISKLITTNRRMGINNSTTRKNIQNSKTNYKQHERQEYNQLKIANRIKTE